MAPRSWSVIPAYAGHGMIVLGSVMILMARRELAESRYAANFAMNSCFVLLPMPVSLSKVMFGLVSIPAGIWNFFPPRKVAHYRACPLMPITLTAFLICSRFGVVEASMKKINTFLQENNNGNIFLPRL